MSRAETALTEPLTGQAYYDNWALAELRHATGPGRYGSLREAYQGYAGVLVRHWVETDDEWRREGIQMQMRGVVAAEARLRAEGLS